MKLKEIISNLDKSEVNEDYLDSEELCGQFNLSSWDIDCDEIREHIKSYWIAKHLCTDTWVGIKAYFYEDTLFAVSKQDGRKCDERFYFIEDMILPVKRFLLSLMLEEELSFSLLDLDQELEEGYFIEFAGQLIGDKVIYKGQEVSVSRKYKDPEDKYGITDKILLEETGEIVSIRDCLVPYCLKK